MNTLAATRAAAEKSAAEVAQLRKQVFELSAKLDEASKTTTSSASASVPQQGVKVHSAPRPATPRTAGVNPAK